MNIEELNTQITKCTQPLIRQEAECTSRVNKNLIENYRDYLAYHEVNYPELVRKQLRSTGRYCKTVRG